MQFFDAGILVAVLSVGGDRDLAYELEQEVFTNMRSTDDVADYIFAVRMAAWQLKGCK